MTRRASIVLEDDLGAGRRLREVLRGAGQTWGLDQEVSDLALLLGSELVNNAVVHGTARVRVDVHLDGGLLPLAVCDADPHHPAVRSRPPGSVSGRGLHLLAALSWV